MSNWTNQLPTKPGQYWCATPTVSGGWFIYIVHVYTAFIGKPGEHLRSSGRRLQDHGYFWTPVIEPEPPTALTGHYPNALPMPGEGV